MMMQDTLQSMMQLVYRMTRLEALSQQRVRFLRVPVRRGNLVEATPVPIRIARAVPRG